MTDDTRDPAASLGSAGDAIAELRRLRSDAQVNRASSGWWPGITGSKWDGFIQGIDACIGRLEARNAFATENAVETSNADTPPMPAVSDDFAADRPVVKLPRLLRHSSKKKRSGEWDYRHRVKVAMDVAGVRWVEIE